ncbi:hypothetical protein [Polaribacter pacificus]|nr:hypothetical protein [Polaribacter pacificus]
MFNSSFPLVSWTNGTILIGVFAVVCVGLVAAVILLMSTDKKKEEK